jgi:hypothetical protein
VHLLPAVPAGDSGSTTGIRQFRMPLVGLGLFHVTDATVNLCKSNFEGMDHTQVSAVTADT